MNILIVGLGSIAQKHIAAIRELNLEIELFALRSTNTGKSFSGIKNIYTLDELDVKIDFVIISNPTFLHAATIKQSLALGCPLFIEKPVLQNLDDVKNLSTYIQENNITTYVACNLRFHPVIQYLHDYLEENTIAINEVNIYCGSYLPDWRSNRNFRTIYSANAEMGGGVHLDLIHEIDYCFWLFGKPVSVRSLKRNVSTLHIDSVDCALFNFLYDSFSANITLNYYRTDSRRDIEIISEKETIKADLLHCTVSNLKTQEVIFQNKFSIQDTYVSQMKYFIDRLKANQKPMNDFMESVEVLTIALT